MDELSNKSVRVSSNGNVSKRNQFHSVCETRETIDWRNQREPSGQFFSLGQLGESDNDVKRQLHREEMKKEKKNVEKDETLRMTDSSPEFLLKVLERCVRPSAR